MRLLACTLLLTGSASALLLPGRGRPIATITQRVAAPPTLLFGAKKPTPPPAPPPDTDDGSFGKALRRLQGSPTRAAMAAVYFAALTYVIGFAPQGSPEDTIRIVTECLDFDAPPSLFFVVFNALGVVPALYAAVLLPGANDQAPVPPATIATAFFAGYGGLGPYLALRRPRNEPVSQSELGPVARLTESKPFGLAMFAASLGLAVKLAAIPDLQAALSTYRELFDAYGIVNVSSFDLLVLSLFFFEPAREDMRRRGWWSAEPSPAEVARLAAFCVVPVLGPAAYVLARPALEE